MPRAATKTKSKKLATHKFHLILTASERDVTGTHARVEASGALAILSGGEPVVVYADREWKLCERESRDDT